MQSIGNENDTALVTAEQLREMTVTPEVIFQRQKESLVDAFMSSMVKMATEQGTNLYKADLHPLFDSKLLDAIMAQFKDLGYTVEIGKGGLLPGSDKEMISVTIKW